MIRSLPLLVLLAGCQPNLEPDPNSPIYADVLGDPIPGLDATQLAAFERGRKVMTERFTTDNGLGPTFNTDSCNSCHQFPPPGGSAPRYRDFFLVRAPRASDGTLVDVGSNGTSPLRDLYATNFVGQVPEPTNTTVYARRNTPPFLGVGLFTFVPDSEILSREDPNDANHDGISGRANYEQNLVGRFGLKAQAASVESFNRGAMMNQMGITSDPLFATFPQEPQVADDSHLLDAIFGTVAHAQVSAPGEPTTDDDGVPDPEMSDADQMDLLTFSVYLSPPKPAPRTPETAEGARLFDQIGCTKCHVPSIKSTLGPLFAYTDLLIHDMGPEDADGFTQSLASGSEFRTEPLWGVGMDAPYLHDGSAETITDAIQKHGGEGSASRTAFNDLSKSDQDLVLGFLDSLGPWVADGQVKITPDTAPPAAGTDGGPVAGLSAQQLDLFAKGQKIFDRTMRTDEGLGPYFNADSCRACHQDPALGGAGGIDVNVLRIGHRNDDGTYTPLPNDAQIEFRQSVPGLKPMHIPPETNVIETRQPPSLLGLGLIDQLPDSVILANADPDDANQDGISGRARMLPDGRLGRFGWKAAFATEADFMADAFGTEMGMTMDTSLSASAHPTDSDDVPDPEVSADTFSAVLFYLEHLAPPVPVPPDNADQAARGQALFSQIGCDACHLPDLGGLPVYSDFLLHDVASPDQPLVDQDPGVLPTEYRTAPLWGVVHTAPYMHSGMYATLDEAIRAHAGEADPAARRYEALSQNDQAALVAFLKTL